MMTRLLALLLLIPSLLHAATYYVDSSVSSSGVGTSWATAWKGLSNMTGLGSGDTVYFSGGSTSKNYSVPTNWIFDKAGVTYKIGQDSGHNGTAIFVGTGTFIVLRAANVTISGNAGDGARHFKTQGFGQIFEATHTSADNWHIEYLDGGTSLTKFGYYDSNTGGELNHCYGRGSSTCDGLFYWQPTGSTYTSNLCHDNQFEVMNQHNGIGSDVFQGNNSYTSFYNNKIYGIGGSYSGGQHQDGHQPLSGNYIAIYNCEFRDIGNYPVFFDAYYGDFNNCKVYNNFIWVTDNGVYNGSPQGIAIGPDGGALTGMGRWPVFSNVNVWNNTVFDMRNVNPGIAMRAPGSTSATWTNCSARNNVVVNCAGLAIDSATQSNNVSYTSAQGSAHFISYSPVSSSNNPRIKAGESGLTNAGTDLSAQFTTDFDGHTRTLPFDIGAFEYGGSGGTPSVPTTPSGTPVSTSQINWTWTEFTTDETGVDFEWSTSPTGPWTVVHLSANATSYSLTGLTGSTSYSARVKCLSATQPGYSNVGTATTLTPSVTLSVTPAGAQDFGMVLVGSSAQRSYVVTANGGAISGTATEASSEFSVSNGTYSLADGTSQTVTVTFAPTSAGDKTATLTFTGGAGTTRALSGSAYGTVDVQATNEALTWNAVDSHGYFSSSGLTVDTGGNRLYATAQTTTYTSAPRALYNVFITTPGSYLLQAEFAAADDGHNSWFVSVDGIPANNNTAIWDMPITGTGYTTANVSWRGTGGTTFDTAQFNPQVFVINQAGNYQVELRGREATAYLRSFTLALQPIPEDPPAAPTGLTATAVAQNQINLAWIPPGTATAQRVQRSATSGSGFANIGSALSASANTYNDVGLSASTTYYYRIVATNDGGSSDPSAEASATTDSPPAAPEAPSINGRIIPQAPSPLLVTP